MPAISESVDESIPALIPKRVKGNYGYINQKGKFVVPAIYHIVMFFAEDCNLLNSPNANVRKFGIKEFATVEQKEVSYRIDKNGKRVYQYKSADLGNCELAYRSQLFHGYILGKYYGVIQDAVFQNPNDANQYQIYPQYEYLHILEGDGLKNPMIIALKDDKYGVVDINNNIIIPFMYKDIKRNFAWKLARMFEVTSDDKNYFFIDVKNQAY